ncbi:HNH endonuclease family protein [Amorphus sp. 3PC139-8]|uniref:HNH endonuclease family protein n=1 Tax=Amorphus sp. 3PC139-8 TaxID=2735676 RepID=UPI00345CA069
MTAIAQRVMDERKRAARNNLRARRVALFALLAFLAALLASGAAFLFPDSPQNRAALRLQVQQNIETASRTDRTAGRNTRTTSSDLPSRGGHAVPGIQLEHLDRLVVAPPAHDPYDRDDWSVWLKDADGCYDTRAFVLAEESLVAPSFSDCHVATGRWYDPYTAAFVDDPGDLDIDHVVPLAEANRSGAARWSSDKKAAYANSVDEPWALLAVSNSANRSKGDRDPAEWLPPNEEFHCAYARMWTAVKLRWSLSVDPAEKQALERALGTCPQN